MAFSGQLGKGSLGNFELAFVGTGASPTTKKGTGGSISEFDISEVPISGSPTIAGTTVINWFPVQKLETLPLPPQAAQYSFVANGIQPSPIAQINWFPDYDSSVKSAPSNSGYTYFSELLPSPVTLNNWYPDYAAEVVPPPGNAKYSSFSELLASPIGINSWYPNYSSEVKSAPRNNYNISIAPVPAIAVTFTPISWYPAYNAEVRQQPSNFVYTSTPGMVFNQPVVVTSSMIYFSPDNLFNYLSY